MSILIRFVYRYWLYCIPIFLLFIFVGSNFDRNFYFGGDLMYPINPQNSILRSLYLWNGQDGGGSFFTYVFLLWQGFFYALSLVQIPIDVIIKIFITTIYVLGFLFSYLLYRTLFKEKIWGTKQFALLFALLFLLNPAAILVVVGTLELYAVPICAYFLVKYLDTKNMLYVIPFSFFLNISFFPGFPQAKPFLIFNIAIFFILTIYVLLRNVKIKSLILPVFLVAIISFLLNAFILVPFVNDAFGDKELYKYFTTEVITYNGDADLYSAAIPFTARFYNSNLVDKTSDLGHYLANPFFISWTFFVLLIGLLSVFFIQDKKDKQLIYICLFAFLVFIFIAKGANPPFGEIYRWALIHIPIAKLFRTTSTSIIGAVIFYTLMLTLSIHFLSQKWKLVLPIIVILHVIVFHGIYLGHKLKNIYIVSQKGIAVPNEYFEMGNILDNLDKDGKVLVLPMNDGYVGKNWDYTGQSLTPWLTKKSVISSQLKTIDNLDARSFDELCSFTSLYNIRYFLKEKDTRGGEIKKDINYRGEKLMENNYFKLQETNESCFLPNFYGSDNTIYFEGSIQNITNLSYLPIYKKNSIIFMPNNALKYNQNEKKLKNKIKNFVVEIAPNTIDSNVGKKVSVYSVFGEDHLIGEIIYPYVRISPDSFLYPLILWKEEKKLEDKKLSNRQLLDLQLFYASKRIKEISSWGVRSDSWHKTQILFKSYMEKAIKTAAASDKSRDNLELTYEYLQGFRQAIKENIKTSSFWNRDKIDSWVKLFDNLEWQIKNLNKNSEYNNLSFFVPQGKYHGYMLVDKGRSLTDGNVNMSILLNNNQIATYSAKEIENKDVIDLGSLNIPSRNTMTIKITNRENLIDNSKWNTVEQMQAVTINSGEILFSPYLKVTPGGVYSNPVIFQDIKEWIPGATYLLKIRHKEDNGTNLHLRLQEKRNIYDKNTDSWNKGELNVFNEDVNSKPKGDELKVLLTADKNAIGAFIYLSSVSGMVQIESVSLERIIIPNIYFVNENNNQDSINQQPIVNFTKIDPTKYKVTINNMVNPYFLVFSETFDKGWRIYGKDNTYLPETEHFLVNGYANAWLINTQNTNNGSSELTVEYIPQRFFYVGTIISIVTFSICSAYGIYRFFRKKSYNK